MSANRDVGPRRAVPRRQDEEGVRGRLAPPAVRVGGAHLEGVGALAEVGELAEVLRVGRRPVAVEARELGLVAHVLGVAVGGGGEFELQAVARVGQAGGLRGEERQRGLAGGRNRAHGAQQGVEGRVQVLQFVQLHAQQAFRAADPEHRLPGRLLLIIEHGGRAGALESVDRKLAPGRAAVLVERERAHDGPDRAVGQRRLGREPHVARGVGVGEREALFQALQRGHRVERVVHRVVREDAGLRQQQHVMVEHADLDGAGAGRQRGAGLEVGDFRRRAVVAERDAQDSLGVRADPQIAQGVLGERGRHLGHERLLRIGLPLAIRLHEPAHAFRVRKIYPSGIMPRFKQVPHIQGIIVDLLQRSIRLQETNARESRIEQAPCMWKQGLCS